ncbi:unnamed protein product [Nesidiocoris tenuis]|uniref:Uncharacterized protein n=1 Tax=Nesidiocoris tenuis TaxID=355587 RepID=A0A6H5FWS2_9HEMI|nr:unnamed protein product [Nesidiocoris tenuis]
MEVVSSTKVYEFVTGFGGQAIVSTKPTLNTTTTTTTLYRQGLFGGVRGKQELRCAATLSRLSANCLPVLSMSFCFIFSTMKNVNPDSYDRPFRNSFATMGPLSEEFLQCQVREKFYDEKLSRGSSELTLPPFMGQSGHNASDFSL